jgi:hypothetical protein
VSDAIVYAVRASFVDALSEASLVCAVVAGVGALLAFAVLPPTTSPETNRAVLVPT